MTVFDALHHPQVLLLAAAYFFVVTASYGVEFFLPSILEKWFDLPLRMLTWAVLVPPIGGLIGQIWLAGARIAPVNGGFMVPCLFTQAP